MKKVLLFFILVILLTPFTSFAQEESDVGVKLGLGIGFAPDYEGSEDYEAVPIPYTRVDWNNGRYLELLGYVLKANLIPHSALKAGPVLQYRRERDDVDNDQVDRMRDVDATVEMGAFFGLELNNWNASIKAVHDVADEHDGFLLTFEGGYTAAFDDTLKLSLNLSTTYASDDYMETYFSVDARDSLRSGLRLYEADDDFKDISLNFALNYRGWEKWSILFLAGYTLLIGDAEDSPLVDDVGDEDQYFGGIVGIYTF